MLDDCTFRPQTLKRPVEGEDGRRKAIELFNLSKTQGPRKDKTAEEVEYERAQRECTFKPKTNKKGSFCSNSGSRPDSASFRENIPAPSRFHLPRGSNSQKTNAKVAKPKAVPRGTKLNKDLSPLREDTKETGESQQQSAQISKYRGL